jgi:hypothetical protein
VDTENETKTAPDCPKEDTSARLRSAGLALQSICHAASYNAGWWHLPKAVTDLRRLIRAALSPERESSALGLLDLRTAKALVNEKLMLIVSEVSEAMEGWRKDAPDDKLPHAR